MERCGDFVRAEPRGDVADDGAVGVVEVVAGSKDFNGLGAAFVEGVEQAGMQALLEKDVGGDTELHLVLSYSSAMRQGCGERGSGRRSSARTGTRLIRSGETG